MPQDAEISEDVVRVCVVAAVLVLLGGLLGSTCDGPQVVEGADPVVAAVVPGGATDAGSYSKGQNDA